MTSTNVNRTPSKIYGVTLIVGSVLGWGLFFLLSVAAISSIVGNIVAPQIAGFIGLFWGICYGIAYAGFHYAFTLLPDDDLVRGIKHYALAFFIALFGPFVLIYSITFQIFE